MKYLLVAGIILSLVVPAYGSVLDPRFNYPPEREEELLEDTNTVIGYMETLGYPSYVLLCYTLEFKGPFSSENCKTNKSELEVGFNMTDDPNGYVNEFCEKMRFVSKEVQFDCLTAAIYVYGDEENGNEEENNGSELQSNLDGSLEDSESEDDNEEEDERENN